jgi:agmatinase
VHLVSTGRAEQIAMQKRVYGAASEDEIAARWRAAVEHLRDARVVILAVPSDVGAGFLRGANMGPQGLRAALLASDPDWPGRLARSGVVDLGDVFVVPQLLHDEMLSPAQIERSRRALYPNVVESERARLPVSPLSITERALELVYAIHPNVRVLVYGGDHSVAWPVSASLAKRRSDDLAIVQFDAHTDLLEERLGVRYCFATWSFHASRLLTRPDRMVQIGVRASRYDRAHWARETGVVQVWADECNADPAGVEARLLEHLAKTGARRVYLSNDIDGTDEAFADATGTPEAKGLSPEFVERIIRVIGDRFELVAGDVMEVAPPVARTPGGAERTLETAVRYVRATLDALLAVR